MPPFFWVVIAIIIISTLVGALAKFLNNLNEMNAPPRNRPLGGGGVAPPAGGGGPVVRQSNTDLDRFLAEIDRLRRKNAEAPSPPPNQVPVAPVVQPTKPPERPRARVVAELAEPSARVDPGFAPTVPAATTGPKPGDLPVAAVVTPPAGTGAPATRVTRFSGPPRPVAKTPFAKNLTTLLGTSQGLALAVVLQDILGPPPSKRSRK